MAIKIFSVYFHSNSKHLINIIKLISKYDDSLPVVLLVWPEGVKGSNFLIFSNCFLLHIFRKSHWELSYFVTHGMSKTIVDSRETSGISVSSLKPVTGPNGAYQVSQRSMSMKYTRYSKYGFSVYLNAKVDRSAQSQLETVLSQQISTRLSSKFVLFCWV